MLASTIDLIEEAADLGPQFILSLLALLVQKYKCGHQRRQSAGMPTPRCSIYLLYWYKSANTDAEAAEPVYANATCAQVTGFTSTKSTNTDSYGGGARVCGGYVLSGHGARRGQVQPPRSLAARFFYYSVYLFYWYKSTNTDA